MAAHQQVGDFTAVNVNGAIQKNGGNVASYFCTPAGRVIHAVIGPVGADELLKEANWALAKWDDVDNLGSLKSQQQQLALAHQNELAGALLPKQPINARGKNGHAYAAMWGNLSRFMGTQPQRVHQLLAERPLAPLEEIYVEVFEHILGQRVSKAGPNVELAEQGLQHAAENNKPLLFVLHHDHENARFAEQWLAYVKSQQRSNPALLAVLKQCVVIVLPLKELPALSHRLKQEPYSMPSHGTPLFVVTDPLGKQLDSLAGWQALPQLNRPLAKAVVAEIKLNPPRTLAKFREIVAFMKRIDPSLADEIQPFIDEFLANQKKGHVAKSEP